MENRGKILKIQKLKNRKNTGKGSHEKLRGKSHFGKKNEGKISRKKIWKRKTEKEKRK